MVGREEPSTFGAWDVAEEPDLAWRGRTDVRRLAVLAVWATGADVRRDGVFRLWALRPRPGGGRESFDRTCRPFSGEDEAAGAAATARMAREYGVTRADLAGASDPARAWEELEEFLGDAPLLVLDRSLHATWSAALGRAHPPAVVDLADLQALFAPGRGHLDPAALAASLGGEAPAAPKALGPAEIVRLAAFHVGDFLRAHPAARALAARGYGAAWRGWMDEAPERAQRLSLALHLADRPDAWAGDTGDLFSSAEEAPGLSSDLPPLQELGALLAEEVPRWTEATRAWCESDPLPPASDDATPLDDDELALVDELFAEVLPGRFAEPGGPPSYREGQHRTAARLAAHLGRDGCLLVHAPTGTGKTLAYLVPSLLWAASRGVRLGVATYTRALQEQAMRRDVPLALSLLGRARPELRPRVALLKGRTNYLCWRSLVHAAPKAEDGAAYALAWTRLALFALLDHEGDLDRFPARPPLGDDAAPGLRLQAKLLETVRSRTECCTSSADRSTCAAEVARRRAERSHVVLTNQSFVLARPEFLRHVVFDECEHLHTQALEAWSHRFDPRATRALLARIWRPGVLAGTTPLGSAASAAGFDGPAARTARRAIDGVGASTLALEQLEEEVARFGAWREREGGGRDGRDGHSLLREYAAREEAAGLLAASVTGARALSELAAHLAHLAGALEELPLARARRVRHRLDVLRGELDEATAALGAWMPVQDGAPRFSPEVFYDVEHDAEGHPVLVARVLLPHEHLGRVFYPGLASAAFVSAATHLRGGFETAARYLGLTRAAEPALDEERPPLPLATFRAPEAFDYGRVLVAVPRDAPDVRGDHEAFLRYVGRFLLHLGERTRGRMLALFTNANDCRRVGSTLREPFRERGIPFWYQRMEGTGKEELGELFRSRVDSVLLGLDTFWYGADFPGETLEYLVLVRLPYGVPDHYHHAQCAAMGREEQRRTIYLPRSLAKFRQGFGRLMRKETDRGCVFVLDGRVLDPRHRAFLRELPLRDELAADAVRGARLVRGDADHCLREALGHMGMLADVRRRGLDTPFGGSPAAEVADPADSWTPQPDPALTTDVWKPDPDELPF